MTLSTKTQADGDVPKAGRFNLSRWALDHQALVRYLLLVLLLGGLFSYFHLGQDEDPPFTFRAMALRVLWPGATAQQIAEQVVDKLEKKLQEVPHVDKIRSYSKPGEAVIIVQLRDSSPPKDVPNAWYQARKKIGDIRHTLPSGVLGPFFNDEFGDTFGTIYAISADGFSYEDQRRYAEFVRQQMLRVPNVAKVDLFGVQDEKIYIEFSHRKFSQLGISIEQVIEQLNARNAVQASGVLATANENVQVRISGQFTELAQIENLELQVNGTAFRLRDFAQVKRGYLDPPYEKMRFNGQPVIGIGVSMQRGGDIIQLGEQLRALSQTLKTQLPVGIEIHQVQDQPTSVSRSVNEFVRVLIEAVVIVLAVSFISLGLHTRPLRIDIWPGLVVGLTIPLVLAATFLLMYALNVGLHKISLGALIIALGLLVDDAIIAVEMMVRKLEEGFNRTEAATFVWNHTAMPMLTGTLITAAGFLPVGLAKSSAGEYTFSIFAVTALALVISWFAAVISTPYLGFLLLKTKSKVADKSAHELFNTPFYKRFRACVDWCVNYRKTVIAATLGVLVLGLLGFRFVEQQFFPDSSRPELMVELWLPEGASFQASETVTKKFETWVQQQADVLSVTSYVGTGAPRFYMPLDQILPQTNVSQIVVIPADLKAREILRKKIIAVLNTQFPEVRGRVKLLPNGPPVSYPVEFRIEGPDQQRVKQIAEQVKALMRANPNTVGVNDNWANTVKVLQVHLNQEKARLLGISSQTVARAAQTVLNGTVVAQLRDENRLIEMVIRQPEDERQALAAISNANLPTATGKSVPLSQIAHVKLAWEYGVLWRENRDWAITVRSDIREGIQGATVTQQIDQPALNKLRATLPAGYAIKIAGAQEQSATAGQSIAVNLPLTVFIIFTLLMLQLHSFSRALMVFLTGPLGFIGAALALLMAQVPFGFVAQLGVIALIGMIIRNSVILVDQIEQDRAAGVDAWTAIVEAAVRRFRPIMLTAAAAVLAMIPLSRSVFWGPMAIAIMGGLIIATLLTLLFLPALYAACFRVKRH